MSAPHSLGVYLRQHADRIEAQRVDARRRMRIGLADIRARMRGMDRVAAVHADLQAGRRLDVVAADMRSVADELDAVVQMFDPRERFTIREGLADAA